MPPDDDDEKEEEPITEIYSDGAYPLYRAIARSIIADLDRIDLDGAKDLRKQAADFIDTFESWSIKTRPTDEERVRVVSEFLTFNRQALEFISKNRR